MIPGERRESEPIASQRPGARKRRQAMARCRTCGLHLDLCVCEVLPHVRPAHRLVIVQHATEDKKPTNTARLLASLVDGAGLVPFGRIGQPITAAALDRPVPGDIVVFPRDDARPIQEVLARPRGAIPRLYLLDGTWGQAANMSRRIKPLAGLEFASLPGIAPSRWGVRTPIHPGRVSTFEAAAHALAAAGEHEVAALLGDSFLRVSELLWWMKQGRVPGSP